MKKLAIFGLIAAVFVGIFLAQKRRTAVSADQREVGRIHSDDLVASAV